MKLSSLLKEFSYTIEKGSTDIEVSDIIYDSRKIKPNCVFVCIVGSAIDSHRFAAEAVKKGAVAVVASKDIDVENCTLIKVNNTRYAMACMSAAFFEHPARSMTTIGITGTKGKTTTTSMIRSILENAGIKTGTIGTLGVVYSDKTIKTNNTTPESYDIQMYLRAMLDQGCKAVVIEASSLGLKWHRTSGFMYDYAVFTNFSLDHIADNEHASLEEYKQCKSMLFKNCKIGIVNIDDDKYNDILGIHSCKVETFSFINEKADYFAVSPELINKPGYLGLNFQLKKPYDLDINVCTPGIFNAYNALAAISVCSHFNEVKTKNIIDGLNNIHVKGRVEPVKVPGNYTLLIDYAHNALSMKNLLQTMREYKPKRLICMFGAGGNRAKSRRYEMGETSGNLADLSILTEDNSRYERVDDIIRDIQKGITKTNGKSIIIPNRKDAIKYCIKNAKDGDIIILAGKGHEDYQEIKGVKYPFDERVVIKEILNELSEGK